MSLLTPRDPAQHAIRKLRPHEEDKCRCSGQESQVREQKPWIAKLEGASLHRILARCPLVSLAEAEWGRKTPHPALLKLGFRCKISVILNR